MITRNDVLKISEPIETMYADCTSQLIINLSRHFATDKALTTREWEAKKLSELGALTEESVEIIAANTGKAPEAIRKALTEGMGLEVRDAEKVLSGAAKAGKIQGAKETWQTSPRVQSVVSNLVGQAREDFNVVNTVMLDSVRNRYTQAIQYCVGEEQALIEKLMSAQNVTELESQLGQVQRALNASTMSVAVGAEARTTALRRTIKQLADKGITGYIDAGGHHWSPEAYINMDIRTTVHNAAIEGQKARSEDYGVSTFQISSHAGARPLCAPYQGNVYSWDGTSGTVHDLHGKEYHYESIYSTSYGEAAGIFGINCGHSPQTFVDGFSIARYEPTQDEKKNAEEYALSQRQRYMEREIRKSKTEALSYEAAGDKEAFAKTAERIKQQNANYKAFCSENGRTPRIDRTQVVGYNRSIAGKATQAAKNAQVKPYTSGKPKFEPASTIQEAETAIGRIIDTNIFGALGVSYTGVDIQVANRINERLLYLYDTFSADKFGGIIAPAGNTKLGKQISGATAAYSPIRRSFLLNRKSLSTVEKAEAEFARESQTIKKVLEHPERYDLTKLRSTTREIIEHAAISGRGVVPETIEEAITHEFGHHLEKSVMKDAKWGLAKSNKDTFADKVSGYAHTGDDEYIAESFASYIKGEDVIDPVLRDIFERLKR